MANRYSLSRHERLKGNLRFRIIKEGQRPVKGKWLVINTCPNKLSFNRIGISISSSRIPKSFKRNRLKRLIREVYRLHKEELKKGVDIIVRPGIINKELNFKEVEKDLFKIIKKAGILL